MADTFYLWPGKLEINFIVVVAATLRNWRSENELNLPYFDDADDDELPPLFDFKYFFGGAISQQINK